MPDRAATPSDVILEQMAAVVAERLLGWEQAGVMWSHIEGTGMVARFPLFLWTWEGMGLLVEAMRERGWVISLGIEQDEPPYQCWANVCHAGIWEQPAKGRAPTLPEAVLRACYAALEGEQ